MGACMTVQGMDDPVVGDSQPNIMKWETPGGWADEQYVLKEKFLSWSGEDFKAKTRSGRTVCRFKGNMIALNSTIHVKDMHEKEIYLLDQRFTALGKKFHIKQNGRVIAELTREVYFGGEQRWKLKAPTISQLYWTINGTHSGHRFVFRNAKGQVVAKSGRSLWQMQDYNQYGVEIGPGTDCLLVLSVLAMMDTACDQDRTN